MKQFADLYDALDATTSTLRKVEAMVEYFAQAPAGDAAWALYFLMGRRLKRLVNPSSLSQWTQQQAQLPDWLLDECYAAVGDLAEVTALLLDRGIPPEAGEALSLSEWIERRLLPLKDSTEPRETVLAWWARLPRRELYLLNKLLTGELRVGVSDTLVIRAVAEWSGLPAQVVAHRVMGAWEPSAAFFEQVIAREASGDDVSRPYPFYLASPLEDPIDALGPRDGWLVEWKWDGIRAQLLRRRGQTFLWSRGEELITERFPEVAELAEKLPDGTVLDGEVLAYDLARNLPMPFSVLQRRIGRQKLTEKILSGAPVVFMAYDLLEENGADVRALPLRERRARLSRLVEATAHPRLLLSAEVPAPTWAELAELRSASRERAVEGLMLKRWDSDYKTGRKRGDWWKWKIDPYTVDTVLVYAHPGHGRRANLFTDYTFAVWKERELVPVAKAYSGLTDAEIAELDKWVRAHTTERFGPVRSVEPTQVFELHFEAIAPSTRHKSGVALRFPRIARWRLDKKAEDADTLERLLALLKVQR